MKQSKSIPNDPIIAGGVGLRKSEWAELDACAEKFESTRNALAAMAIRKFLKDLRDGNIDMETKIIIKPR